MKKIFSSNFLLRAFVLISLKESYFFLRNLYGLIVHPFKTIVEIRRKPDWSQTILIFGLPAYVWLGMTFLFLPVFYLFRNWYGTRILLFLLFYSFTLLLFLVGCYLLFWAIQYFLKCKLKLRN